ncbi:hypothetical protein OE88DRAFT_1638264 [Heliocybe sulcata]|uniref:Zn(2)-C6 fungal-type domain-containing protein n=1 Tax=Heliocybe sulcata TaxID=5364 RepID=A0A5C3MNT9_9AGAM|nr:hypothetical protein OE88DRAFT_1638264 [Heliocybe sulcata]
MDPGTSSSPPSLDRSQSAPKPKRRRNNEVKRARGEISCAECRRLKMKCDKQIPCGTCTRRGCANICPQGVLSGGQGSRLILADTQALHRKITQMSERIRHLEDALSIMQADISQERHPLLRKELLHIKHWPEVEQEGASKPDPGQDTAVQEVVSAFGTLTVGEDGEAKYFGQSAGSELEEPGEIPVSLEITSYFDQNGPNTPLARNDPFAFESIEAILPSLPRAWALLEAYYAHAAYNFRPVQRDDLVNDIMSPIYRAVKESSEPGRVARDVPHKVGLLLLVFAMGALVDLTNQPYNEEAHKYYLMARSAMTARSITDSPVLETVQALSLVAVYHSTSGRKMTAETSWEFLGISLKLAQSVSRYRDCAGWNLDAKTVRRRRYVFWELYTADVLLSLHLGRPPAISLAYVDCEFPLDEEQSLTENGEVVPGFWAWKYSMARDLLGPISECLATTKTPSYEKILDFDRRVRQKGLPKNYNFFVGPDSEEYHDPSVCIRTWLVVQYRLIPMLYIHRPYFAQQALMDNSGNPLCSPYAPSFLAAYRSASVMIKRDLHYFERCPDLFLRYSGFWFHGFAAAVVMGLVVVRMPKSTMSLNALAELNATVDLFEKGAQVNIRARRSITFLRKLKSKAQQAYFTSRNGASSSSTDGAEELALFGGQTKLIQSKFLSKYWAYCGRPRESPLSSTPSSSNSGPSPGPFSDLGGDIGPVFATDAPPQSSNVTQTPLAVHPSLVDYLSNLPAEETDVGSTFSFSDDPMSMDWTQTAFQAHFPEFVQSLSTSQYPAPPVASYHESASAHAVGDGSGPSCHMIDDYAGLYTGFVLQADGFGNAQPSSDMGMDQQFMSLVQSSGLFDGLGNERL